MTEGRATALVRRLNQLALVLAFVVLAALGGFWWRERTRRYEPPAWPVAGAVAVAPATAAPGPCWIVAVNPDCLHCRARLADLERRGAAAAAGASLGVLLVDVPRRPDSLELGGRLPAGVWWDPADTWRRRWGHRLYGETLVFGADGRWARTLAPADDPAAAAPAITDSSAGAPAGR